MKNYKFPKYKRLLKRGDFQRLNKEKRCMINEYFYFFWRENGLGYPRIGISINKKIASAVKRNRIKRLIREVFRLNVMEILLGRDLLIMVRKNAISLNFTNIRIQLIRIYYYINFK